LTIKPLKEDAMTTRSPLLAALLAGLFSHAALAADTEPQAAQGAASSGPVTVHFDSAAIDNRTGKMRMWVRNVKNAPYSAQVVTERTQALGDGNQIATRHSTMTYRDSAGRTRQEITNAKGDVVTATIHDPVASATFVIKPQERTVMKFTHDGRRNEAQGRGDGEIIAKRVERADGDGRQRRLEDVHIQVSNTMAASGASLAPLANAFGDAKWSAKATTRDLGTRDFNGVKAEGKLRSYEIPAGEVGNRNPIVVSDENWFAPDLQVAVYTKHSDPRSGDFVFRLENLKREEPAAALFAAPADYTVKEPQGRGQDKAGKAQ
jgi:hypothetical protein